MKIRINHTLRADWLYDVRIRDLYDRKIYDYNLMNIEIIYI